MTLITDFQPLQQPDNSTPFALNIVADFHRLTSREPGNILITLLRPNYDIIGKIYFDNKVLLF